MEDYYISINSEQSGPFSLEELKEKKLTDEYLVWTEGFESWLKASEVFHLKESVVKLPPPLPDKKFAESKAISKALGDSLIPLLIVFLIVFVASGGFSSNDDLKTIYPNFKYEVDGSQIRTYIICWSTMIAVIPSLIVLIIDYRFRIKREIIRLNK